VSDILAAMREELPPNCLNPEVYKYKKRIKKKEVFK